MLRLRRFRVLLFFALALIFGFYYLGRESSWTSPLPSSLRSFGTSVGGLGITEVKEKIGDDSALERDVAQVPLPVDGDGGAGRVMPAAPQPGSPRPFNDDDVASIPGDESGFPQVQIPPRPVDTEVKSSEGTTTLVGEDGEDEEEEEQEEEDEQTVARPVPVTVPAPKEPSRQGSGSAQQPARPLKPMTIHWEPHPEHYPVPSQSIIPLPTGRPKEIPRVQYHFGPESSTEKRDREGKQDTIRKAFMRTWSNYRKFAWMHDELKPVSGGFKDPFAGWGATLVDSLDTLWIMGLTDEFEEAVNATAHIDFTTSERDELPLFEVTIRYLGGLIGAYDVSGQRYKVLKDKAVQLADVLMGAFDTPNRMPLTYYNWKPMFTSQPHKAGTHVVLAEIGTLSMEFIRLAQITKDNKYYDAVARITTAFYDWQNTTKLPGLFPVYVDTSGCKDEGSRSQRGTKGGSPVRLLDEMADTHSDKPASAGRILPEQLASGRDRTDSSTATDETQQAAADQHAADVDKLYPSRLTAGGRDDVTTHTSSGSNAGLRKRQNHQTLPSRIGQEEDELCLNAKFSTNEYSSDIFTMGGMADSVYEYFPKAYLLLGGLVDEYKTLHEGVMNTMIDQLVYRPMIPDENRQLRFTGAVHTNGKTDSRGKVQGMMDPNTGHLTCFVGGLVGLGAKIFNRDEVDLAAQLADGCSWAYASMKTGVMAEDLTPYPCESTESCPWDETLWLSDLDSTYRPNEKAEDDTITDESTASDEVEVPTYTPATVGGVRMDRDALYPAPGTNRAPPASPNAAAAAAAAQEDTDTPGPAQDGMPLPGHAPQLDSAHIDADVGDAPNAALPPTARGRAATRPTRTKRQLADADTISYQRQHTSSNTYEENLASLDTPSSPSASPDPEPGTRAHALLTAERDSLAPGIVRVGGRNYILRPEAIESLFYLYRITGQKVWRDKAWEMFTAIERATRVKFGYSALADVTADPPGYLDTAESFWTAETLKYFYLMFCEEGVVSLDDWVFNTEAHPFLRPDASVSGV